MKPRGANKNPYGNFIHRGLISPTHQQDTQESVDKEAEANVTWSDWSEWADDPNNPGQEIRTREGKGEAVGFSEDPSEREKQKQWIKDNPELYKKLLAEKNKKETETREKPKTEETQVKKDVKPQAQNLSQEIQDFDVYTGAYSTYWDGEKWVRSGSGTVEAQNRQTGKEGEYDESYEYSDQGVDKDFEGVADDQIQKSADIMEQQDLDQNLSVEVIDEDDSPMKQTKLKSFVRNYLHSRSPMKQKTTYISNVESEKKGVEGWKENKARYENAEKLKSHLESSGKGDKANLDVDLAFRSMLPEVEVTPTKQEKKKEVKLDDVEVTQVSPSRTEVKVNDKKHSARLGGSF